MRDPFSPYSPPKRLKPFLKPLALAYGAFASGREALYSQGLLKSTEVSVPVVSIGNLALGGNRKTPLAAWLAGALLEKGFRPAILSRGYGRKTDPLKPDPILVSRGLGPLVSPDLAGDEPYLLAKETKAIVAVAKNRLFAARLALENGANFLVLDDGFQHLKLKRDVDILAAFGEKPFGEGWPLPAGPLRERLSAGQRAHLVIAGPKDPQNPWGKPQYAASLKFLGLRVLSDGTLANPEIVKKARVAAFAALARPGDFFKSLKEWGFRPVATLSFPDHAPYGPDKIRELAKFKLLAKVDYLLTTPKDSVKLGDLAPAVLAVETALVPGEPNRLLGEILALIPPKKLEA